MPHMESDEYRSMVKHLDKLVDINLPVYKIIKNQILEYDDVSLKKFRDYCYEISKDIEEGKDSNNDPLTSDDEFSIYINVFYYRLIRNLISVRELLKLAKPESECFEAYEFSIGILLRSGLCDCRDFYIVDLANHIGKYLKSSFKYLVNDIKKNSPGSDDRDYEINYFTRLRDGIGNCTVPLRDSTNDDNLRYLEEFKKGCDYSYSIYSKYDHFSLYEISPMIENIGDRKSLMYKSIMVQVPALAQCLIMYKQVIPTIPSESIDELHQMLDEWIVNYDN